jgi:hypothetical protein
MRNHDGALSLATRQRLAQEAFQQTALYDMMVSAYLSSAERFSEVAGTSGIAAVAGGVSAGAQRANINEDYSIEQFEGQLPGQASWTINKTSDLRYGENPHQLAALYQMSMRGIANAEVLAGKEMSFNNYVDADAAWALVNDLNTLPARSSSTRILRRGLGETTAEAYKRRWQPIRCRRSAVSSLSIALSTRSGPGSRSRSLPSVDCAGLRSPRSRFCKRRRTCACFVCSRSARPKDLSSGRYGGACWSKQPTITNSIRSN